MRRKFTYYGNWVSLLRTMLNGPVSLRELEAKTGIDYETLRPLMKALHAGGVVHISHWRIDSMGRMSIACYQLGYGVDALKRKPKTGAQRMAAHVKRKRAAEERPLPPASRKLVPNATLDQALRGWGQSSLAASSVAVGL